jgi:hypothetical protein
MVTDQPVVILIDRGLLDGSAYVSKEIWQSLCDDSGFNLAVLRDNRYDCILHLVTAAEGALGDYDLGSNEARYESPDEAREKDKALQNVYMGHPKFHLIRNNSGGMKGFE